MIYGNWPLAAMVIINLPRHLWKRPTAGVYIYCVAVGSYCLSATQWVEPFRLNQRLCPPLKPLSAAQCQVCSSLFVVLSLLNTSLHHLSHPREPYAQLCTLFCCVSVPCGCVDRGVEIWRNERKRDGAYGGVRASQNRDGVSSPPLVWINICAVGWQLQTSLSADALISAVAL